MDGIDTAHVYIYIYRVSFIMTVLFYFVNRKDTVNIYIFMLLVFVHQAYNIILLCASV